MSSESCVGSLAEVCKVQVAHRAPLVDGEGVDDVDGGGRNPEDRSD